MALGTLAVMRLDPPCIDPPSADPVRQPLLRVGGPAELVQAVPYLIGFHPQQSLVLVGLDDCRLVVTARLGLDDTDGDADLGHAVELVTRAGVTGLIAVIYDEDAPGVAATAGRATIRRDLLARLQGMSTLADCRLLDALLVGDGRWWSLSCNDVRCCPSEGTPIDDRTSPFAAAATFAGLVPLADRAAVTAVLDPLDDDARHSLDAAIAKAENASVQAVLDGRNDRHERSVKRALFAAARAADAGDPRAVVLPDAAALARFAVALTGYSLRDAVWTAVDDGRIDGRRLWAEMARRLPSPYDAPPLFLFGWCSWRDGNGTLAGVAANRAVESDPTYSAADLLLAALSHGLDPRRVPKLRRANV